jgi:inner membrane protein
MDSLTHIVLGACIGEVTLGRKIGKKAMLWGALAQSLPDIDFVAGFWMDTSSELLAHRGITHSLLFAGISSWFLALVADRVHRPHDISLRRFILFFAFEILVHLLLDACNNYGVGWFEPFSDKRVSFNSVYVADPFFSLVPAVCFFLLLVRKGTHQQRRRWAMVGLWAPVLYFGYTIINKLTIDVSVREMAERDGISYSRYFTTPSPLNNWLWFVVMEDVDGFHVGYRSVLDGGRKLDLQFFPRNDGMLSDIADHEEVQELKKFSQGYYTAEKWGDSLVFNDLRFGQVIGWQAPRERFVFHYFLSHPEDNELVVQRGRFAGWTRRTPMLMMQRIMGQ